LGSWESHLLAGEAEPQRTLAWSDEVFRIFGYEPGQVQPGTEHFYRAVHPEDRDRIRQAVQEAIRLGRPYELDHRILLPDGSERVVHEQAEMQYEPGTGRPAKLVGTVRCGKKPV